MQKFVLALLIPFTIASVGRVTPAHAEGCSLRDECGGADGSGGKGGPTGKIYNFYRGTDYAPITVTRDGNGNIDSATATGKDGVKRTLSMYTDWTPVYTHDGDYASTRGTTYIKYSDSAGYWVQTNISALTDQSGMAVTVQGNGHWITYGQAGGQAQLTVDGAKHYGSVSQMHSLVPAGLISDIGRLDYFKNIYALMWNEHYKKGQPVVSYDTPGSIDYGRYFGDGVLGTGLAIITGASGVGAVAVAVGVIVVDAWQNEPQLRDGANWFVNVVLCMSIESLDYIINPGVNALTDPSSMYMRAGCSGF